MLRDWSRCQNRVADRVRTADDGGHEQEYARHKSHADLLRERIDGRVGQ
jgi:Protein of unknown function (DUF664)